MLDGAEILFTYDATFETRQPNTNVLPFYQNHSDTFIDRHQWHSESLPWELALSSLNWSLEKIG